MKRTSFLIAGAVAVVAASSGIAVMAQSGDREARKAERVGQLFDRYDLNKDDAIDSSEIEAAKAARFTSVDTNGDGAISLEEMTASAQQRASDKAAKRFSRMDANADGVIDQTEVAARGDHKHGKRHHGAMLERLDTNEDGKISRDEALSAKGRHGQRH